MMPPAFLTIDNLEQFLKVTAIYGLGFVVLALLSVGFLWFLWKIGIRLLRIFDFLCEWLPQWFKAQIESHQAVVASADKLTESMGGVREKVATIDDKVDRTHAGMAHLVTAGEKLARRHADSDLIIDLRNAKTALAGGQIEAK